jgi:hypothetical protein
MSVVSRYMHDSKGHLDAVYHILRYLKSESEKGLFFRKSGHLNIEGYTDADWASCVDDRKFTTEYCMYIRAIWSHEKVRNNRWLLGQHWELNTGR